MAIQVVRRYNPEDEARRGECKRCFTKVNMLASDLYLGEWRCPDCKAYNDKTEFGHWVQKIISKKD